jgi:hypothetical protein
MGNPYETTESVIPAKAGIQGFFHTTLDAGLRRHDETGLRNT